MTHTFHCFRGSERFAVEMAGGVPGHVLWLYISQMQAINVPMVEVVT